MGKKRKNPPGRGHTRSNKPSDSSGTSHWPFPFRSLFSPLPARDNQGLQAKASPPTRIAPEPSSIEAPLLSLKPADMQTSTECEGAGAPPSRSSLSSSAPESLPRSVARRGVVWNSAVAVARRKGGRLPVVTLGGYCRCLCPVARCCCCCCSIERAGRSVWLIRIVEEEDMVVA